MAGLSGRELDRLSGLGEGLCRMIETGERVSVEADTALKYATTLGVSLDWLVAGHGAKPSQSSVVSAVEKARSRAA